MGLKALELSSFLKYSVIQKLVRAHSDSYTKGRLAALSKMSDWITELDSRMARIRMEMVTAMSEMCSRRESIKRRQTMKICPLSNDISSSSLELARPSPSFFLCFGVSPLFL